MEILVEHGADGTLSKELIDEIKEIARRHGNVSERIWGDRAGAIDLVTVLEIVGVFAGMKILDGLVEGLVGKDYFIDIGKRIRRVAGRQLKKIQPFLEDFYKVVLKNKNRYGAFAIIEFFDNFELYVVLNHKRMNEELIKSLPDAIAIVLCVIALIELPQDSPRVFQLYPNFETGTWGYLFMPSNQAFSRYIDRYFDLREGKFYTIASPEKFIEKFNPDDKDDFKLLISPNRDHDMSKFDEL